MTNLSRSIESNLGSVRDLEEEVKRAVEFAGASRADRTKKAYRIYWGAFETWAQEHQIQPLPAAPAVVATFASHLAHEGLGCSSIQIAMSAIALAHRMRNLPSPTKEVQVRETLRGIRRTLGTAPNRKAPVTKDELQQMVEFTHGSSSGTRDRALLLVGFTGAFRRSELVGLDVADLEFSERGVLITVRRSKTDQEGHGMYKALPRSSDPDLCPVRALQDWLSSVAKISHVPVFLTMDRWGNVRSRRMSDRGVALTVKRYARMAGLDVDRFAGHSLRAGFATEAILAGKLESEVMRQTGHRSVAVFRDYVRVADVWKHNAAKGLL